MLMSKPQDELFV